MRFVQLIEYRTHRIDEVTALFDEWDATEQNMDGAPGRVLLGADHDTPNTYVLMVEFASYEDAMRHSARPETTAYSQRLRELCDGEPSFHNLDVVREESSEQVPG